LSGPPHRQNVLQSSSLVSTFRAANSDVIFHAAGRLLRDHNVDFPPCCESVDNNIIVANMDCTTVLTTRSTVADVLLLVQERRIYLSLYKLSVLGTTKNTSIKSADN